MNRKLWLGPATLAIVVSLVFANPAFGWGVEGHAVVASIAERHLTPAVLAKAQAILGPGVSLESIASWADSVRNVRPATKPLHFIDIPLAENSIVASRDCAGGNCVTDAITKYVAVLKDASASDTDRNEALKFVVHFVGDLHQPLHCEDNNDRGGNSKNVIFLGKKNNLHSVWDTSIIVDIDNDTENFADTLNQNIQPADITKWETGAVEDWALEAHTIAQKVSYGKLSKAATPKIGAVYLRSADPAVQEQLERAGIRLAHILNQTLQ